MKAIAIVGCSVVAATALLCIWVAIRSRALSPFTPGEYTFHKVIRVSHPDDVARGLMFRERPLDPDEAMLFDKGDWSNTGFWMKNTLIPMDVLFLDDRFRVIAMERDMVPGDLTVRGPKDPWRYAVECAPRLPIEHSWYIKIKS